MKLGEKIKQIREEKGLTTVQALAARLKEVFGKKALGYNAIYRIEKGLRDPRISSLGQICLALEISLKDLKEDTEEEKFSLVDQIKRRDTTAKYVYSNAHAEILSKDRQRILALRLILFPGGKTNLEQDPLELGKFEKWVYGLKGKTTCVVGENKYILGKDEVLAFESNIPHYFENNTLKKAACIVVQNPKHI